MKHERKQTIMDEQFYDSNNSYETPSQEIPVYTPPTPKKREKKNRMGLRICALALVFALLGGALGASSGMKAAAARPERQAKMRLPCFRASGKTAS